MRTVKNGTHFLSVIDLRDDFLALLCVHAAVNVGMIQQLQQEPVHIAQLQIGVGILIDDAVLTQYGVVDAQQIDDLCLFNYGYFKNDTQLY